jgi:hypothetical protein
MAVAVERREVPKLKRATKSRQWTEESRWSLRRTRGRSLYGRRAYAGVDEHGDVTVVCQLLAFPQVRRPVEPGREDHPDLCPCYQWRQGQPAQATARVGRCRRLRFVWSARCAADQDPGWRPNHPAHPYLPETARPVEVRAAGQRDRFELSGDKLEQWLLDPSRCVEILRESPRREASDDTEFDSGAFTSEGEEGPSSAPLGVGGHAERTLPPVGDAARAGDERSALRPVRSAPQQPTQFDDMQLARRQEGEPVHATPRSHHVAAVVETDWADLRAAGVSGVLAGLGFEDRAAASMQRITEALSIARADLVEYNLAGRPEILGVLQGP